MKIAFRLLLLLYSLSLLATTAAQGQNSVLANGNWYKIEISESGVYKLSYEFLLQHGIINGVTPAGQIKVYGYGGMLPEARSINRPWDLPQLPVAYYTGNDDVLQAGEFIYFYAEGPHKLNYNPASEWYEPQANIYSDKAYYFITVNDEAAFKVASINPPVINKQPLTEYEAVYWQEPAEVNLLQSGREWYGHGIGYDLSRTYNLPFQNFSGNRLKYKAEYLNAATATAELTLDINGKGTQTLSLPRTYGGQYDEKGYSRNVAYIFSTNAISANALLTYNVAINSASRSNKTYLNTLLVQASCAAKYTGSGTRMIFPELATAEQAIQIEAPEAINIWNIAEPGQPIHIKTTYANNQHLLGWNSQFPEFYVFNPTDCLTPTFSGTVANQNIKGNTSAELLIVTTEGLLSEANRLADFRRSHDGLNVAVVLQEEIFNEFSSGRPDLTAIRDYAAHLYHNGQLKYLLLFGRGSYDFKNIGGRDLNRVLTYQSYNSTSPTNSYVSDDYLGFLEDTEGNWTENEAGNQTLDIGIGRLPVLDATEAKAVVDKLINYSTATTNGAWRNKIAFVADDEDANQHFHDAEGLSEQIAEKAPFYQIEKYYVDAFPQLSLANGKTSPKCASAIEEAINQGLFVLNFSGHGSRDFWTQERIMSKGIVASLENSTQLPIVVTATCDFGEHDGNIRSGGETFLLNENGGAIGLLTTARPVYSSTNYKINRAFYNHLFSTEAYQNLRIGDIIRLAKNESTPGSRVANRNFILLGDPSMRPAYPSKPVLFTSLENTTGPADRWRAHDRIRVNGHIGNADSTLDSSFNGKIMLVLYDKAGTEATYGYGNNTAVNFQLQDNALFRGEVEVTNGSFEHSFILPKNINYSPENGAKLVAYSVSSTRNSFVGGVASSLKIYGSGVPLADNTPPQITSYLNNPSFNTGDGVEQNAQLIAHLKDDFGINTSSANVGQNLIAYVNDTLPLLLNEYYIASNTNSAEGSLQFTLPHLPEGRHTLSLTAWDLNDNQATSKISFVIGNNGKLEISTALVVPNPVVETGKLLLTTNRTDDSYEANIVLYNAQGKLLARKTGIVEASGNTIEIDDLINSTNFFDSGIYVFKISIRSLSDNSFAEKTQKFTILH